MNRRTPSSAATERSSQDRAPAVSMPAAPSDSAAESATLLSGLSGVVSILVAPSDSMAESTTMVSAPSGVAHWHPGRVPEAHAYPMASGVPLRRPLPFEQPTREQATTTSMKTRTRACALCDARNATVIILLPRQWRSARAAVLYALENCAYRDRGLSLRCGMETRSLRPLSASPGHTGRGNEGWARRLELSAHLSGPWRAKLVLCCLDRSDGVYICCEPATLYTFVRNQDCCAVCV